MSDSKVVTSYWRSALQVRLKSEYLKNSNFQRFGARPVAFEEPCWPLGLRTRGEDRDITSQAAFEIIDTEFDHDASCAWQLPLRYSRLNLGENEVVRNGNPNWIMRCIGRWQRGEDRYPELMCTFNDDDKVARKESFAIRTGYALTPFSVIAQRWIEDEDDSSRTELLFCDIAFFYTFETFIQECLALDAFRSGIAWPEIVAAYEHVYCNARPRPEFSCIDPATLGLSRLSGANIDWRGILDLKYDGPTRLIQSERLQLFNARRQCHLMTAIAAACIGIPGLGSTKAPSRAVRIAETPFAVNDLAAHWLTHVSGEQDYPAECERLLVRLAEQYRNPLSENSRGIPEPPVWIARNSVEESVDRQIPPILLSRGEPEAYGRYRWALFDTSLDDESISDWRTKVLAMQ
jgi:hypothetical protein